jgi:tetratricopeptide (TPR) repeat protein
VNDTVDKMPKQFSPPGNSACLCGSGLIFKKCCAERLPVTKYMGTRTRTLRKEGNFKEALRSARADLTQYMIWHKSHTEPAVKAGMPKKGSLFEIDIRASVDLVETLAHCYREVGKSAEFPAVLERLRANIEDISWQRKIIYLHALHALGPDWNEDAGRRELQKLGSIAQEDDVETIQLYLDLFGDTLSLSQKLTLVDRVIKESNSLSDVIHYKGLKAVLYLLVGDQVGAETELSGATESGRSAESTRKLSKYESYRLAQAFELLGTIRKNTGVLDEALKIYRELVEEPGYTRKGRANLFRSIGDANRQKDEWAEARKAYEEAIRLDDRPIFKVFLAECLIQLGQISDAEVALHQVAQSALEESELIDYVFVVTNLAIELGDRSRLERAKDALNSIAPRDPLFRGRRDEYLIAVQEALASGSSQKLKQRARSLLMGLTRSTTRYLVLRPTIMGVGIDFGKILEDLSIEKVVKSPKPSASGNEKKFKPSDRS